MTTDHILTSITDELRSKHGCHTVILYGSRARGDATETSDYDVLGVRETGEVFRDARLWNGVYLDSFVYSEKDLLDPHDGMLDMRHGKVLFQKDDFAERFFARLEKIFEAGPKKLRADEIQALLVWHEKALARIHAGGIQGNLRRTELVPALLEHFFTTRGEWYRGPKASFQWLKTNRPDLYDLFDEALKPDASARIIESLVKSINAEIEQSNKPANASASPSAVAARPAPTLRTDRLMIRLPAESDVPFIVHYFKENEARFAPTDPPKPADFYDLESWRERVRRFHQSWKTEQALNLYLFEAKTNEVVGTVSFTQMSRGPFQACYLGYGIAGKFEGKGMMTDALKAAIGFLFDDLNFHRVMANHLPDNERSARVLKRLGFVVEGAAKDYLFINGKWRDHVLNALSNPKWEEKKSS